MKIGLFAKPGAVSRLLLGEINRFLPGSGYLFDWTSGAGRLVLDGQKMVWDDHPLTDFDRIWVHGFHYANPVVPEAALCRDWSVWQADYLTSQQEYSALFSLFEALDRRGVVLLNPPRLHINQFMKFAWLEDLRRNGFCLPALLCSNDADNVDLFCQQWEIVVWRPATGRGAWQLFQAKQRADLIDPGKPPILLAEGLSGPLVRAYLLNGKLLLCLQTHPPQHLPPMESLEYLLPVPCTEQRDALERLAQVSGMAWGVVTFVPSPAGPCIYDLDPDPVLDWLPAIFRNFLLTALAGALTGQESGLDYPEIGEERPNMFMRRMLKILFELEYSKYG